MNIHNAKALAAVRNSVACMYCRKACWPCDPHHLWTVGAGRLDCEWNLVPLCRVCHSEIQGDEEKNTALKEIIAVRFGCRVADMTRARHLLLQLDKDWDKDRVRKHLAEQPAVTKACKSLLWLAWEVRDR